MRRLLPSLAFALPLLVGMALRLATLPDQILGGDELHAVRAALEKPLPAILGAFEEDNSFPLTAYDRLLVVAGVKLSELALRLPVLLAGLAVLLLLPRAAAARCGRPTALVYAWLLALSPLLVLYSRVARSYEPLLLLTALATFAFDAWWSAAPPRPHRAAAAYVAGAAGAAWFHLAAGPAVAAPFAFAVLDLLAQQAVQRLQPAESRHPVPTFRELRDLFLLGLALSAAFALFLLPAWSSLTHLVADKTARQAIPPATWAKVAELFAGSSRAAAAVAFWLAAVAGLALLARAAPRLAGLTLTVALGQAIGIRLLSPVGLSHPMILDRYLLPALPLVLLWVAVALAGAGEAWARGASGWRAALPAAGFLALLAAAGPLAGRGFWRSSFQTSNDFVGFFAPRPRLREERIPAFYGELARRPDGGAVLEVPWPPSWDFSRSLLALQEIHGRRVLVAPLEPYLSDPRLGWRNAVAPAPPAMLASPARWVVLHLDFAAEQDALVLPRGRPPARPLPGAVAETYRREARRLVARLRRLWGSPDYADESMRAWDLERVRRLLPPEARDGREEPAAALRRQEGFEVHTGMTQPLRSVGLPVGSSPEKRASTAIGSMWASAW